MTNEDLCDLGKDAYILFTGLWMLADREGRLEDRPRRIKAEAMPLWDDVSAEDVENLVGKLEKKGFIHRYEVNGNRYISITTFKRHQHPHPRETASEIPAPPVSAADSVASDEVNLRHALGSPKDTPRRAVFNSNSDNGSGGERTATSSVQNSLPFPPPPPKSSTQKRKQPRRAHGVSKDGPREAPASEDAAVIRESLEALAREYRLNLPPPDSEIVQRILEAGHGHSGAEIHGLLVSLGRRDKFREMRSWGLIPLLVEQWCRAA